MSFFSFFSKAIDAVGNTIKNGAEDAYHDVTADTAKITSTTETAVRTTVSDVTKGAKSIYSDASKDASNAYNALETKYKTLDKDFSNITAGLQKDADSIYSSLQSRYNALDSDLSKVYAGISDKLGATGKDIYNELVSAKSTAVSDVEDAGKSVYDALGTAKVDAIHDIEGAGKDIYNDLGTAKVDAIHDIEGAGSDVLKGLNDVKSDIFGFFQKYIWYVVAIVIAIVGGYAGFKYYEYDKTKHFTDVVRNVV